VQVRIDLLAGMTIETEWLFQNSFCNRKIAAMYLILKPAVTSISALRPGVILADGNSIPQLQRDAAPTAK
jgi:hypothetical protein